MQKHVSHLNVIERSHKPAGAARRRGPTGRGGHTRLLMVAVAGDRPGIGKSAAFQFPGWDEGSDTFDVLAAIAGIVQDTCLEPGDQIPGDQISNDQIEKACRAVPDD